MLFLPSLHIVANAAACYYVDYAVAHAAATSFFCIKLNAIMHIITEKSEPAAVASPIGSSVLLNIIDVRYTPGTRTITIARILCKNDKPDFPQAQK